MQTDDGLRNNSNSDLIKRSTGTECVQVIESNLIIIND
jgi:hypothetical protein